MDLMTKLQIAVQVALLGLYVILGCTAWEARKTLQAIQTVPAMLDKRAAAIEADTMQRVDAALARLDHAETLADARTAEALKVVRSAVADADAQISGARADVKSEFNTLNATVSLTGESADSLLNRYQRLPDEIRADREYQGLVAETMGVLGASKVTMGAAAKTANVIAAEAPKVAKNVESISASFAGIADDGHKFTNAVTKPKSFWGKFRDGLQTGGGLIRALNAAGVL